MARNKASVGANAFAHEAGIHQHGMMADASTFEIMTPADVGADSVLVLSKHSGRLALSARAERRRWTIPRPHCGPARMASGPV